MNTEHHVGGRTRKRSLRDFLYVVFGHKKKVLAFTVLLFGAVCIATLLKPSAYRSEAKLLVRMGRETVGLDPTATLGEIVQINRSYDAEINSELEILKSREIAERVVDQLGKDALLRPVQAGSGAGTAALAAPMDEALHTTRRALDVLASGPMKLAMNLGLSSELSEREQAVRKIMRAVKAQALPNTSVISLTCKEKSPHLANSVLDKFIQAYIDKHVDVFCAVRSHEFFERQVSQLQAKLAQAENELQTLKDTTGISSLEEQRTVMVGMIGTLDQGIAEAEAELASATARITGLQTILSDIPETIVTEEITGFSDYGADLMRSRLYDLRLTEKDVEAKYRPDSRQLEMIRKQVDEGMEMLDKELSKPNRAEIKKGMNSTHQQVQMLLLTEQSSATALESRLATMRAQTTAAKAELKTLNDVENKTKHLEREIALLTESYSRYVAKLEEARIDQALTSERFSNISILQAATVPATPIGPSKSLHLLLGLLLALGGGVGFAFVCEHLDHSIKTPEDVHEKLQLPTLASIPQARLNTVAPSVKSSRWKVFGGASGPNAPVRWDIPVNIQRHYAAFREQLLLSANGSSHGHCIIGVTSCSRSEGVSTVAANLASSLSEQNHGAILLVDANVHHPNAHRIFRTRLSPGLVDVLAEGGKIAGSEMVVRRTTNLNVLTAGGSNHPAMKTITPDSLLRFLHAVKQDYRFIVVDMPAMDEDSSAIRLAGSCDGVVLVVEAERLRWEVVSSTRQQLRQQEINVLGVLLNKRRFPVPNWLYAAL